MTLSLEQITNDFSALITRIEDNLETKGVTASYDSVTGLNGLVDEILNIETGETLEIQTSIDATFTYDTEGYTVGDIYQISGVLLSSSIDELDVGGIDGAIIKFYNHNDLLGYGITNNDGEFTINGRFNKISNDISFKLEFEGTTHFVSSQLTGNSQVQVSKKVVNLPQELTNVWVGTTNTYTANIGSEYAGTPVVLELDGSGYASTKVTSDGDVIFKMGGLNDGNYTAQLNIIDRNYIVTPSNTFTISVGLDLYVNPKLTLTSDKNILSYADAETATLTATLMDNFNNPISGESVSFKVYDDNNNLLETLTGGYTNSNGVVTTTFDSHGYGDVNIKAEWMFITRTYEICDARYHNNGSSINGLSSQNGVSTTSDGEWITITTNTSEEKYVLTPISFDGNDNWEFSCKCKTSSFNSQALGWQLADENSYTLFDNRYFAVASANSIYSRLGGSGQSFNISISDNDIVRVQRVDGYWKIYVNNTLVQSVSHTWSGNKTIAFYTNQNRVQHLKELVIKQL